MSNGKKPSEVKIYDVGPVTATMIQLFENEPNIEILRVDRDRITYRFREQWRGRRERT